MVPRLCDRHAAARLTRRHLKVLLVDLGYAINPFIVFQVLVARGLGGALLLHVRLDLLGDRIQLDPAVMTLEVLGHISGTPPRPTRRRDRFWNALGEENPASGATTST